MSDHLGKRLSALIDGELGAADRERVLGHLVRCEDCRQEAAELRMIKERMRALGEATAGDALNRRLMGLASLHGQPAQGRASARGRPARRGDGRRRHRVRSIVVTGLAVVGLAVPTAAFMAGGGQRPQGPKITPSVDVFMVQHAITTGEVPVLPSSSAVPVAPTAAPSSP